MASRPMTRKTAGFTSESCRNHFCMASGQATYGRDSRIRTTPIKDSKYFMAAILAGAGQEFNSLPIAGQNILIAPANIDCPAKTLAKPYRAC